MRNTTVILYLLTIIAIIVFSLFKNYCDVYIINVFVICNIDNYYRYTYLEEHFTFNIQQFSKIIITIVVAFFLHDCFFTSTINK